MHELAYPFATGNVPDPETAALRVPPHSIEAEQAVLGGLMLDNSAWDLIVDRIVEEDFYRNAHRLIFRTLHDLASRSQPFDVVTLSESLGGINELDNAGGLAYLAQLAKNTPSAANIRAYTDIVRERSVQRQLIRVANEIGSSAFSLDGRSVAQMLDDAEQRVFQIAEQSTRGRRNFVPMKELMGLVMDRIDLLAQQDNPIIGISSGFNELDKMTAGLQPSDLIIVAGRPSMGKTSFAMNIAEHAAIKYAVPSVIFSMEMSAEQLALRMLSSLSRLDHNKVRTGKLEDDDWPRLSSTVGILGEAPLYIDDTPSLTPMDLRARARRLKRERGLGLIVVDYLQLMQVPGTKETRANEISEISRSLKALAKELNVPVIALSQLNRNLESRTDKRPVMSDLRESGGIEQDADLIMMIYRDEVYNETSPDKGTAEINIVKQRNGPIGGLRLTFLGQYTRFENFIPSVYSNEGYA
ncbi:MAG: replicative DNA helicase [Gammaproteobacteria bacterium]|nr:replicative DNA helicase [Gammaproteobacteria bacterium]